ncbi:MAG TPA: class I SAM-dependent methyltransferase [Vicinamibacterales bacterium]|nr:class I SAM-dependent methyltransferase [Vicinamibacterales bacterium]
MKSLSKLCDAGDWFDPEFDRIVRTELEEQPRLHRKQWEFAQIFRALRTLGFLRANARGLSMGGGVERLLYALARHVGHLTVTDLYESASAWEGARSDDPDRFVKDAAPFPIDHSRVSARRMDMRALEFADRAFDFCYSSCAIEHIGAYDDFLTHLREVRRVLKDDGVYVLTTEFHYGDDTIPVPNNYYFSSGLLAELVDTASLEAIGGVDGSLWPHTLNTPLPSKLSDLCAHPANGIAGRLLASTPHVQLLTGGLPFTSLAVVLTRAASGASTGILPMAGLEDTRRFIEAGVRSWKAFVERTQFDLDPFGLFGDRSSRGTPRLATSGGDDTLFHTGYVWLGGRARSITVELDVWPADASNAEIEIRVHRQPVRCPDAVSCDAQVAVAVCNRERLHVNLSLATDEACSYAVLGKLTAGGCWACDASVQVSGG